MAALPRVYVVDDDELMRRSLTRLLSADYDVMCFAAGRHFLDAAAALPPGCLILDLHLPEFSGLEIQRQLAARNLHFPIIMITGQGAVRTAVDAMKAGAVDFVEKPFRRDVIIESVRLAQKHLTTEMRGDSKAALATERLSLLSVRELQVLRGLVAGLPNKSIAYDLGISPRTVEMHRAHIMLKMEVRSLSALLRTALAAGIEEKSSA